MITKYNTEEERKQAKINAKKKYYASEKGKLARQKDAKKWRESQKGKEYQKKYDQNYYAREDVKKRKKISKKLNYNKRKSLGLIVSKAKQIKINCFVCNKTFIKKPNQKYCSIFCAKKVIKRTSKIAQKKYHASEKGKETLKKSKKKYYSKEENIQKRRNNNKKYVKTEKGRANKNKNSKKQYEKYKDKYLEKNRKWSKENKEFHKELLRKYRKTDGSKLVRKKWEKNQILNNPRFRLERNIRARLYHFLTWKNYGKWHVDHVKPLSMFDVTNEKELYLACNFKNLQPMWAVENLTKGNRRIG